MPKFPFWSLMILAAFAALNVHVGNFGVATFMTLTIIIGVAMLLYNAICDID